MKNHLSSAGFIMAAAVLAVVVRPVAAEEAATGVAKTFAQRKSAAILTFAVRSEASAESASLAAGACADYNNRQSNRSDKSAAAAAPASLSIDADIVNLISSELLDGLSKKGVTAIVDPDPAAIQAGTVIVTGCVVAADKGSAAGRMFGMGLGASRLVAHVVFLTKTEAGIVPADAFDLEVKGRSVLPPSPASAAVNAATERSHSLAGDARKLAERIIERLDQRASSIVISSGG